MSLFDDGITVHLNPDEFGDFSKFDPSTADGGPKSLYLTLVGRMSPAGHLTIEDELAVKVYRYGYSYGDGGYQTAFRAVTRALWRAGWVQPDVPQSVKREAHKNRRWAGE